MRGTGNAKYAISLDLDANALEETYPGDSSKNAYADIARFLHGRGFERQQGSVYFGGDNVDVVICQNAVLELALEYDWFGPSVRDIRMLRIEDNNDLMATVELALRMKARMV